MTDRNARLQLTRRAFIQRTALSAAVLAGIGSLGGMLPGRVEAQTVGELYSGFDVDFYCAPSDLGTGDGSSEANAMALVDALALTHAPGTVIGVLPGNYSTASPIGGNDPAWQLASNGTSGAPIRVVAKYSAVHMADPTTDVNASRLRHTGATIATGGVMVGGFEKEYQQWWGFLADENYGVLMQDAGVAHWRSSVGCAFHRMRIIAIDSDPGFDSNHSGISVRNCENILIQDNRISGFNHQWEEHNHNGLVRYDTFGLTLRNNEIFDCATGFYLKDSPVGTGSGGVNEAVYFNLLYDCRVGIEVACTQNTSPYYTSVYQNIVRNCEGGILIHNDTVRVRVYNNTVVLSFGDGENGCIALNFTGATTECRDNIFVQLGGDTLNNQRYRSAAPVPCDYNRYYTTNAAWYRYDDNRLDSLPAWRTLTSTDLNSSEGDPLFVDLVNNDFHLSSSSPCLTLSSTAGPLGAYITGSEIIGVTPAAAGVVTYQGFAVDLYCAPADLGTGDGSSETNAMALIDALALTHAPGTVIGALPGNYSTASTSSAFDPAWQISSNGTSGAPIRVVAKYSAVHMTDATTDTTASRLRHTGTTLGAAGVMVGGLTKEYQQWWGFLADENYGVAPEGAAVAHWYSSTGCAFRRMRIIAVATNPGYSSDNHSGIGVRESESIVIQDNRISGFNHGSQQNNSGIVRYDSSSLTIRNNDVFDCGIGIFLKDNPPPGSPGGQDEAVYFNVVHDCTIGIEVACAGNSSPDYSSVYQNIVLDCDGGIAVSNDTERVRVYNNTVVLSAGDGDNGCVIMNWAGATSECRDNIFVQRGGDTLNNQRYRSAAPVTCNYNRYYSTGTAWYRYDGNNRDNLADWQTLISSEANSSAGNPLFVDLTGNDFHLSSSSPCLTMSSVAGPVGAYISGAETIGVAAI